MDFSNYDYILYLPNQPEFIKCLHPTLDFVGEAEVVLVQPRTTILYCIYVETKLRLNKAPLIWHSAFFKEVLKGLFLGDWRISASEKVIQ